MKKLKCIVFGHDFKNTIVKGKKVIQVAGLSHEYETIIDVKLICTCCGTESTHLNEVAR